MAKRFLCFFLKVSLPTVALLLAAKDDAAEFDESEVTTMKYEDDPKYVSMSIN